MATFDELIQDIGSQYSLGPNASLLVQETVGLISGQPGGIDGFLDRFKAAGFAAEVASWSGGTEVVPLSGEEVEQTLGSEVISEIANKADISQSFARTIMGYAIPKIIVLLAQGEAVPPPIPASESSVPDLAIQLSSSPVEEKPQPGAEQIRPSRAEHFAAAPPKAPSRFKKLFVYGSRAALAACLFGFARAAGSYFSTGQLPFYAIKPPPPVATQESVERTEVLRATQEMAEDIRALKANVEALRAAQSRSGNDAAALEGLQPYDEDRIDELCGTGVRLKLVKACTRCVITATNQDSGEVEGDEPLRTLRSYRYDALLHGVRFGQNAIFEGGRKHPDHKAA